MDALTLLRTLGGLAAVLALLAGGLWLVKRRGAFLTPARRLEITARAAIDPKSQLVVVRWDNREHLIAVSAAGLAVVDSTPLAPAAPVDAMPPRLALAPPQPRPQPSRDYCAGFAAMVTRLQELRHAP